MIVSREKYEELHAENTRLRDEIMSERVKAAGATARAERLDTELQWLRGQLGSAYDTILTLRREGFDPPRPQDPASVQKPDALPSEVRKAIESVASPGEALWGQLMRTAGDMLANETSPKDVAAVIRRGSSMNPHHA
jgi:hypothetical protein